jgi:ABC-2 type transport system ATP-binding protein
MEEVEAMCESICLVNRGRAVLSGRLKDLKARYGRNTITVEHDAGAGRLGGLPGVQACDDSGRLTRLQLAATADPRLVMRAVLDRIGVASMRLDEPHVEDIYLQAIGEREVAV